MLSVSTALRPCSRTTRANSSAGSERCCGSVPCPYSTAGILPARRVRRAAPLPNSVRVSASMRTSATVLSSFSCRARRGSRQGRSTSITAGSREAALAGGLRPAYVRRPRPERPGGYRGGRAARARRRLRGAVRPADRPPGARGAGLLRDRARRHAGRGDRSPASPAAIDPLRRPGERVRRRARRASTRRCSTAGVPVLGLCYGFQAMALALGGEVAPDGTPRVRPHRADRRRRRRRAARRAAGAAPGVDEPRRLGRPGARRVHRDRGVGARGGRGVRGRRAPAGRRAVPPRGRALARTASRCCAGSCTRSPGSRPGWTTASIIDDTVDGGPGADRRRPGDLRAVRRRRLRGGRRARPAGHRRPADLRVRRPRAAAGRASASRWSGTSSPPPASRLHTVDAADRFLDALAGVTDPETKRKIIGREFIRVFEARGAPRSRARASTSGSSCRARSTRTSWSPAAAPARRRSRATTTSAGCRTTSSSRWSSRCGRCSRTRCARSAPSSGCPTTIVGRQPFPGPGLGIRIIGEVTAERLDTLRAADAIAREELTAAGLDRDDLAVPGGAARRRAQRRRAGRRPHATATRSCCARCPARTR